MTKKLITAADGNHHTVVLHIISEILLNAAQHLFPVRSSAQKHNVKSRKINTVFKLVFYGLSINASPLAALPHALDISPVPIQVQQVRI